MGNPLKVCNLATKMKVKKHIRFFLAALAALMVSCAKTASAPDKGGPVTAAADTVSTGDEGLGNSQYSEGDYTGDKYEAFAAYNMRYSIAYLGTVNNEPVEMNIIYSTENDSVWGGYFSDRVDGSYGDYSHDIQGVAPMPGYSLGIDNYEGPKARFNLSADGHGNLEGNHQLAGSNEKTPVSLTAQQDVRQSNTQIEYNYRVGIVKQERDRDDPPGDPFNRLREVVIFDADKKHLQTIRFDEAYVDDTKSFATLRDMNFDGYLDLDIEQNWPLAIKDGTSHSFYLYNPDTGRFDESSILNGLHWAHAYYSRREIETGDANGNGYDYTGSYQWMDNKLYLVREKIMQPEDDKIHYKEYTVQNGKSIVTREYTN